MKHIKGLDTLRAFAVLFVIIEHWGPSFDPNTQPILTFIKQYFIPDGPFGVDLFFVLSGFLITAILLKAKSENEVRNDLLIIKNFYIRRTLRIFPIYYLTLFFLYLIHYQFPDLRDHILWYVTYRSNILFFEKNAWGAVPHTWSLAVEEQFYLLWPWLIIYVKPKYLKYVFAGAIAVGIISSYITTSLMGKGSFAILVVNCMGCFGIGGAYAYARLDEKTHKLFEKILLFIFPIILAVYFHWKYAHDRFWEQTTFIYRMVDGVIALQIIVAVLNNKNAWIRKHILENRTLNFIGTISYGIYLYHYILQPLYDGFIGRQTARHPALHTIVDNFYFSYTAKLVLVIFISWLSYKFIEKPIMALKNRFKYEIKT